jgi:tetratricopeptide (TPR) repeat protein
MKKRLVILSIGLLSICGVLSVCGVLVGASRVAQSSSAGTTDGGVTSASDSKANDDAVTAQKKSVIDSIAKEDLVAAEVACWQLVNQPTPHALHEIVDEADTLNKLPEVRQVFQDMITARPKDPDVIWLKTGLAIADVHLGDDTAVQATQLDIIAKHGSDDRVVEALGQIAWACRKLQRYDKAVSINQYTVDNWPGRDRVAYAQQGIVLCQIGLGDITAADKALDVLMQKFGKDADASKLLLWSAFGYDDAGQKDRAQQVYGLVVQNYPDAPEAVTAQLRRALASVEAEDPNRMEQDISTLLNQFAPTQDKGQSLRYLADTMFWKSREYANGSAKQDVSAELDRHLEAIANYMLANWPNGGWVLSSERDLATVQVRRGDDAAAEATYQQMLMGFAGDSNVPQAVFAIGEAYHSRAGVEFRRLVKANGPDYTLQLAKSGDPESVRVHLRKAVEKWDTLIDVKFPGDAGTAPAALYYGATAYVRLGDRQKAFDYCTRIIQQWPDYENAWLACLMIAGEYSRQMAEGTLTLEKSRAAIGDIHKLILEKYPTCPAAASIRSAMQRPTGRNPSTPPVRSRPVISTKRGGEK